MYRHSTVRRIRLKVSRIVKDLYDAFISEPELMPEDWMARVKEAKGDDPKHIVERARIVADYIAGMTDRYAIEEHQKLFNPLEKP